MRTFTDTAGRTWTITIDSAMAGRLRQFHRVNASGLLFNNAHFASVVNDRAVLLPVLATLLDDQLRLLRRDAPTLEATMDARTHQGAIAAFAGALLDYLPAGEQHRLTAMLKAAEAERLGADLRDLALARRRLENLRPDLPHRVAARLDRLLRFGGEAGQHAAAAVLAAAGGPERPATKRVIQRDAEGNIEAVVERTVTVAEDA